MITCLTIFLYLYFVQVLDILDKFLTELFNDEGKSWEGIDLCISVIVDKF